MKPILFNTDMVRALQNGTKTVTRRLIKNMDIINRWDCEEDGTPIAFIDQATGDSFPPTMPCPYQSGDILYVPQPWKCYAIWDVMGYEVEFQDGEYTKFEFTDQKRAQKWAKYLDKPAHQWQSPYFMPREAAQIFLWVTDVRVERLQEITDNDLVRDFGFCLDAIKTVGRDVLAAPFWDSTIKPADRALYGWEANPWVWVIEFERCKKPKGD